MFRPSLVQKTGCGTMGPLTAVPALDIVDTTVRLRTAETTLPLN